MDLSAFFTAEFTEHADVTRRTQAALGEQFAKLVQACVQSLRNGGKLMLFGNGGSAADAQHLAAELTIRYKADRPAIAALALTTDTSALTAAGNDLGFDNIFARQIAALGRAGDVALGISTSGKSPNVLAGLRQACEMKIVTAGLSGRTGGDMAGCAITSSAFRRIPRRAFRRCTSCSDRCCAARSRKSSASCARPTLNYRCGPANPRLVRGFFVAAFSP
jgi:D-sedoheptulose 7-phosphate isomerase